MKIKKLKCQQIFKLHLLNSKLYDHATKNTSLNLLTSFSLTQAVNDFKKILYIIFQYHQADKKILFIGIPKKLELKINKLTKHVAVSNKFNLQGVILNSIKIPKPEQKRKQLFSKAQPNLLLPKLFKKPDLIVLFSHEKKQNIINESSVAKVPLILFGSNDLKTLWINNSYVFQRAEKTLSPISTKNLFFFGLNFLFKIVSQKKTGKQKVKSSSVKHFYSNPQRLQKRFNEN